MEKSIKRSLIIGAWLAVVWLVGCQSRPDTAAMPNIQTGSTAWGWPAAPDEKWTPGLDKATVEYGTWNGDLVFAIWIDRNAVNAPLSGNGANDQSGRWEATYFVSFSDAPQVKVECRTSDGTTGSLTVNAETFDLSRGRLVLISTAGGKVRAKQLQRDELNAEIDPHSDALACFSQLKADADVIAFFTTRTKELND